MIAQSSMWIDATAGVAGDMLLGALLDLDAGASAVQKAWDAVLPGALKLQVTRVQRAGQASTHAVPVLQEEDSPHRHLSDICALLDAADLDPWTRTQARAVFELLADAEAHVHGTGRTQCTSTRSAPSTRLPTSWAYAKRCASSAPRTCTSARSRWAPGACRPLTVTFRFPFPRSCALWTAGRPPPTPALAW
ncbi:Protein of uncharacterised function DUF111 [Corynebacterium renale]|nr:Protein of uncharacterised function DUF111 [Corynebacterium renale]